MGSDRGFTALIEEIRSKISLSSYVGQHISLKKRGHEHWGLCPFHQEKTPSFTVNDIKAFYHCFGCGAHGSIFDFIQHVQRRSFLEAVQDAASLAGVTLPASVLQERSSHRQERKSEEEVLFSVLSSAQAFYQDTLHSYRGAGARDYLISQRGFSPKTLQDFGLGFSAPRGSGISLYQHLKNKGFSDVHIQLAGLVTLPEKGGEPLDKFSNRVMFPIFDTRQRLIAFGGRSLGTYLPKYINSPETPIFKKSQVLYNLNQYPKTPGASLSLLVVEGYTDVLSLVQAGVKAVVAPMGTALTSEQIQLLWRYENEPVLCFDGDAAGLLAAQRAAERALPILQPGKSLSFLMLPVSEDPDSFVRARGSDAFKELQAQAIPLGDFLWNYAQNKYPRRLPEEKAALEKTLEAFTSQLQDTSIRSHYRHFFREKLFQANRFVPPRPQSSKTPKKKATVSFSGEFFEASELSFLSLGDLYEKILVGAFAHHPVLLLPMIEELGRLSFKSPFHTQLQEKVVSYFFHGGAIEKDDFTSYLKECGFEKFLQEVAEVLKTHAPYFHTSPSPEICALWEKLKERFVQWQSLTKELENAKHQLEAEWTLENWNRYRCLKEILLAPEDL